MEWHIFMYLHKGNGNVYDPWNRKLPSKFNLVWYVIFMLKGLSMLFRIQMFNEFS